MSILARENMKRMAVDIPALPTALALRSVL
jgi:hypothetical protein